MTEQRTEGKKNMKHPLERKRGRGGREGGRGVERGVWEKSIQSVEQLEETISPV